MEIKFESSERSTSENWVKGKLISFGISLIAFEGYTVKDNKVSLLIDRGQFEDLHSINIDEVLGHLLNLDSFQLQVRLKFAESLSCEYYFFCYSYVDQYCIAFSIKNSTIQKVLKFESWTQFAQWTLNYRDLKMISKYEESGLPILDQQLRKDGIPWPGNLDYLMVKNAIPFGILEFQNTSKATVKDHCNNKWFLPTEYRKGDVNRWHAIDIIRTHSQLPLFIIVWSKAENTVKVKLVDRIVYPEDSEPKKGLIYKNKEIVTIDRLEEILAKFYR